MNIKIVAPITFIILIIGAIYLVNNIFTKAGEEIKTIQNEYKSYIGETYIMKKDTLLIIDYSMFKETFTLSNGVEVNSSLIIKDK